MLNNELSIAFLEYICRLLVPVSSYFEWILCVFVALLIHAQFRCNPVIVPSLLGRLQDGEHMCEYGSHLSYFVNK